MVTAEEVRRLALAHPEAADETRGGQLVFTVGGKGFAWTFMERVQPKQPRVPKPEVLAVRCELLRKEMLIAAAPEIYFDDAHYRGYPGVLVRLAQIDAEELEQLLAAACRLMAPKRLGGLAGGRRGG
jgi:hypothetical protein